MMLLLVILLTLPASALTEPPLLSGKVSAEFVCKGGEPVGIIISMPPTPALPQGSTISLTLPRRPCGVSI